MKLLKQLKQYLLLMRFDKPIGILLLLWPTLWALWLAAGGWPDVRMLFIFVAGVIFMRAAGCVMNDVADRHIDGHVARTRHRPLVSGGVTLMEALLLAAGLGLLSFLLVLQLNRFTIFLAFIGAGLAVIYPFMKRFTHLPQCGLGLAFAWGIPMAFAAIMNTIPMNAWFLFLTGVIWPVMYDTLYAMVDREDDHKIGVKSTAILFGEHDVLVIGLLQLLLIVMWIVVGALFQLHMIYYASLVLVVLLFMYQQWLIRKRTREDYFQAFLNNNWVGLIIFIGIFLSYV